MAAVRTVIGLGAQVRIYYDDADVQVTSWAVWVRGYRYGLADLDRVWRQDTAVVSRRVVSGVGVLAVVLVAKAATSAVFAVAGLALGLPATAAALYAVEDLRRYGRRRELWASVRGLPVLLVRTDDALRYGRLCRSVARAMEDFRARPRCERR